MKTKFNQKFYEDVLNYCTSIKNETHSLTYWEATVLRKLIHINFTNEVINYSNRHLAKMLFRPDGENNVKNTIGKLIRKGFITSANIIISDGNTITKRRTIKIDWNTIEVIYNSLPNFFSKEDKSNLKEDKDVSDNKILEKKESVLEEPKTDNKVYKTTFINNAGEELNIEQQYIEFFNDIILKKQKKEYMNKLVNCTSDLRLNMEIEECKSQYEARI